MALTFALLVAAAMGSACALLSVFVVLRRWAFIGEGIAHAGFGGAGTACLLALALPWANTAGGIFLVAILFCLAVALAIGYFTRREGAYSDSIIGIFLVASLAWGFIAQAIYKSRTQGQLPGDAEAYLLGSLENLSPAYSLVAAAACLAVIALLFLLGREILYYCFDPTLAEVSGVRVGFIHYLMILLVATTIILGMRIMGSLLVTALLVLPGAAALQLSRNIRTVIITSLCVGLVASIAGPLAHSRVPFLPIGPAIVVVLVLQFLSLHLWARFFQQ